MARLSQAQARARERLMAIARSGGSPSDVASRVMVALGEAIGWDGHRLFGVDPGTGLVNRVLHASDGDDEPRDEWLREVYLRTPDEGIGFVELGYLARTGIRVAAFQPRLDLCFGYPAETLAAFDDRSYRSAFIENRAPVGGTIGATFLAGDRWVAALQVYRRDPGRPFRASDVAFLRLVSTQVAEIVAAALDQEAALAAAAGPLTEVAGILVVDRGGRTRYASPAGEMWVDALRAIPGEAGTRLPTALWGTIAGLDQDGHRATASVRLPDGGAATVEATTGGDDGSVALVITPVRPPDGVAIPAAWVLTAAEARVAELVIQGQTNRAISESLFISENTVEWHVRRIFEKAEVRSRGQLAAQYFQQVGGGRVIGQRAAS